MIRFDLSVGAALALLVAAGPLLSSNVAAQAVDMAAERARIANERIRRDMQQRQSDEESPATATQGQDTSTGASDGANTLPYAASRPPLRAPTYAPTDAGAQATAGAVVGGPGSQASAMPEDGYSRTLAQLRVLGELHDAGYLTDDEFARIKTRIISSVF